jgi:CelD/BcsL family acetyltransferase involved in cellulose biosynthesis
MVLTSYPGAGPLQVGQLQFIGADENITELRGIAAREDLADEIYLALLKCLRRELPPCSWIKFSGIRSAPVSDGIAQAFTPPQWIRDIPSFVLKLRPSWEEFRSNLPRNIRESLRKCYNSPRRDGVELDLVTVTGGPGLDQAVSDFLRLHAARAQLAGTVTHPNVFRLPQSRRFLHEVCHRFAARRQLCIYQLKHGENIVASRIGFICNDSMYLYYSGYDPEYSQYSVMTRVVAEAIRDSISRGLSTVNLSTGRDVSKERWRPDEVSYQEMEVVLPGVRHRLAYATLKAPRDRLKRSWSKRPAS